MLDRQQDRGSQAPSITSPPCLPVRHQRSRRRGERTPAGIIYVGRPTIFGNPFDYRRFGHARCVRLYARWLERDISDLELTRLGFGPAEIGALRRKRYALLASLARLTGLSLQCWCPLTSRWCHADTLIALANAHDSKLPGTDA